MEPKEVTRLFDLSASIDETTAALQTKTCIQMLEMLQKVPGIILGDDVGMGKTYIAFSAAVWFLARYPRKKIVIITPNWLLNSKWHNDIRNFIEKNLNSSELSLHERDIAMVDQFSGTYINQIRIASKQAKVILIPINVFASKGWRQEKNFFLSCWLKHRRFRSKTRESILKALGSVTTILSPEEFIDIGITYQEIPESWYVTLDKVYEEEGLSNQGVFHLWKGIKELRDQSINEFFPRTSLLILDEAHKMKNAETVKRRALETAISRQFEKGLFLTATPFQLGEGELRSVLDIFKSARITEKERFHFDEIVCGMFKKMNRYQILLQNFEDYVHAMSPDEAIQLEIAIKTGSNEDYGFDVSETYDIYQQLLDKKKELQEIMKQLIIRNIKKKDTYRNEIIGSLDNDPKVGIPLSNDAYLPFALLEKAIFQIIEKGDRTFITNVKQTLTSSFAAVQNTSIYNKNLESMNMLRQMNINTVSHPKLNATMEEVVTVLTEKGEKTLLFCDRLETINQLKKSIEHKLNNKYEKNINSLFPDNGVKGFENYCRRFYHKLDVSWFLLQEAYIHSVLVPVLKLCGKSTGFMPDVNDIAKEVIQTYKKYNITVKANYMYIKRIVEQIVFRETLNHISGWQRKLINDYELLKTVQRILDKDYIEFGITRQTVLDEEDTSEETGTELRSISNRMINTIINYKGIWFMYHDQLNKLPLKERDDLVNSMIHFLRRDKRFFIKLRELKDKYPTKNESFLIQKTFANGNLLDWQNAFQRFLNKYCNETSANREELLLGLSNADVVAAISGSTGHEARKKIKAGFNTPFYPHILIVTATMQEGFDLQVECKRVFHYDLEWNPASLEQRVGRVDRIGSLTSTLRKSNTNVKLDVYYPYIKHTIDESIYNTVKDREKWFNIILGGTPQWDTFEIDSEVTNIEPWVFKNLQIHLGVE